MSSTINIQGLHHITLVCSNAQRTVDFYTQVLGQRFVKKTVNFDDPGSYHLYFGDELGHPGSVITFFEWPGAPKGHPGIGGTHHFAMIVQDYNGLLKWKRRLMDLDISTYQRASGHVGVVEDPDGERVRSHARRGTGLVHVIHVDLVFLRHAIYVGRPSERRVGTGD